MSKKDLMVFRVCEQYRKGMFTLEQAAQKLSLSTRSLSRKLKSVREKGLEGLVHGNKGRAPKNKHSEELKAWYIDLYKETYFDFNFLHAYEKITKTHNPSQLVSYDVFRKWLKSEGLGKVRRRRSAKARKIRERHANQGFMVQLDGSPHRYNGKDKWTLINVIDDATSVLLSSEFAPGETTFACLNAMRQVIKRYGIPEFVLTDKAGWSAKMGKRAHFSQFERAMNELGCTIIATSSAPSKGRVERSFRTCQDRLTSELRLAGIKRMENANRYLEQIFRPYWNQNFVVEPQARSSRFRPLEPHVNLENILCLKHSRIVNRDHTVSFGNQKYKILNPPQRLWKHEVTINEYESGKIKIFYGEYELITEPVKLYKKNRWTRVG